MYFGSMRISVVAYKIKYPEAEVGSFILIISGLEFNRRHFYE